MPTLREFLQENAGRVRAEVAEKGRAKREWLASVAALYGRMEEWLRDSDPEGLLTFRAGLVERVDPSLGTYEVGTLEIWMGARMVEVEPIAFDVLGPLKKPGEGKWRGRVDLLSDCFAHKLYRFVGKDDEESWFLLKEDDLSFGPLTRDSFEAALMSLLS